MSPVAMQESEETVRKSVSIIAKTRSHSDACTTPTAQVSLVESRGRTIAMAAASVMAEQLMEGAF